MKIEAGVSAASFHELGILSYFWFRLLAQGDKVALCQEAECPVSAKLLILLRFASSVNARSAVIALYFSAPER